MTVDGEQDWESLTVRGWLRAAGLQTLFAAAEQLFPDTPLAAPSMIYASRPRDAGAAMTDDDGGSRSKRPLQTITPLAARLGITPNLDFGKGDETALADHVRKQKGIILISWQHEAIDDIARQLVADNPPRTPISAHWPDGCFDLIWVFTPPPKDKKRWAFTQIPQQLLPGDLATILS